MPATPQPQLKVMVKDPDGHSIAFAQAPDAMPTKDAESMVRSVYEAYVSKNRAAIEALIADDFHFSSPLDNRLDRAAYFSRCWPNSKDTEGFEFIHLVQHDAQVFVTYEARLTGGHRFRNTEIVTVRGSQIVEVEVYFGWNLPHRAAVGGFVNNT
jgi:SnoaL-like domain